MSSPRGIVLGVLKALEDTGLRWCLLKDESSLARGISTSDIDVVVDTSAESTAGAVVRHLGPNLVPIALWPYDVGAASLFVTTVEGGSRVQLDLMHDPAGRGKYGIRSKRLIETAEAGERWPAVSEIDSLLYEIYKRIVKRQQDRLPDLLIRMSSFDRSVLVARTDQIFIPRAARTMARVLVEDRHASWERGVGHRVRTAKRYLERLRLPVGFWAHVEVPSRWDPTPLKPSLERLLPHVTFSRPSSSNVFNAAWLLREVAPIRWRPGLIVSWGVRPGFIRPDFCISGSEARSSAISKEIINAMGERLRSLLLGTTVGNTSGQLNERSQHGAGP